MKYKYFIAFVCNLNGENKYGNIILETDMAISSFGNTNDMMKWIRDATKYIEERYNLKDVVITNYQLVN